MKKKNGENNLNKKKFNFPHVYIVLLIVILVCMLLTYIIPAGQFDRQEVNGRNLVVPGTYHEIEQTPVSLFDAFVAIPQGFVDMANIAILIFLCVAGMGIITSTGAVERVFGAFINKMGASGRILMLILFYVFFFVRGGLTGSNNSPIAFIPLLVTLCLAVGYDVMTALGVVAAGALIGFAVGPTNPNTVVVAQQIAELPIYSGMTFRTICWIILGLVGFIYVVIYGERVRKRPELSLSTYRPEAGESEIDKNTVVTTRDKLMVLTLVGAIVAIVTLTLTLGLSMIQMAGLYIIVGIIAGIIAGYSAEEICNLFTKHAEKMFMACMVLGMAKAVSIVLTQGNIIDTVIYWMSNMMEGMSAGTCAVVMFIIQTVVNFFINSGSGQAAAMMPIMVPLADLVGVSRQTAVLAFQMGDGFSNIIWPTSGTIIAYIFAANEKYEAFLKFIAPLFILISVIGAVMLVVATMIGY